MVVSQAIRLTTEVKVSLVDQEDVDGTEGLMKYDSGWWLFLVEGLGDEGRCFVRLNKRLFLESSGL